MIEVLVLSQTAAAWSLAEVWCLEFFQIRPEMTIFDLKWNLLAVKYNSMMYRLINGEAAEFL
jgi:hypothetical protein